MYGRISIRGHHAHFLRQTKKSIRKCIHWKRSKFLVFKPEADTSSLSTMISSRWFSSHWWPHSVASTARMLLGRTRFRFDNILLTPSISFSDRVMNSPARYRATGNKVHSRSDFHCKPNCAHVTGIQCQWTVAFKEQVPLSCEYVFLLSRVMIRLWIQVSCF